MKTVTILLTKHSDWISTCVYYICGRGYTHASLSLDGGKTYYSFNYKGFCIETIEKHRRRGVKYSRSYQLNVSDEAWSKIYIKISQFLEQKESYRYTRLGLLFCILRIPFQRKKHYFCSQFVAELLIDAEAIALERHPALYLPNDFCKELESSRQLEKLEINPIFFD